MDVSHLPLNIRGNPHEAETFSGFRPCGDPTGSYEGEIRQFKRRLILRALRKYWVEQS